MKEDPHKFTKKAKQQAELNLLMLNIMSEQEAAIAGLVEPKSSEYNRCRVAAHVVYAGLAYAAAGSKARIRLHCTNVRMEA